MFSLDMYFERFYRLDCQLWFAVRIVLLQTLACSIKGNICCFVLFLLFQTSSLPFKEPHKHLERVPGLQGRLHSLTPTALYDPVALCKVGTSQMCWSIQRNKHPWCSEDLLLPAAGKLEMLGCSSQHSSLGTLRASLQTLISWGTVTGNLPQG